VEICHKIKWLLKFAVMEKEREDKEPPRKSGALEELRQRPSFLLDKKESAEEPVLRKSSFLSALEKGRQGPVVEREESLVEEAATLYRLVEGEWSKIGRGRFIAKEEGGKKRVLFAMEKVERVVMNTWVEEKTNLRTSKGRILLAAYNPDGSYEIFCVALRREEKAEEVFGKIRYK
jgi:hypothetical protein